MSGGENVQIEGKQVIALGERDGVPGEAITKLALAAGAADVHAFTQCFV